VFSPIVAKKASGLRPELRGSATPKPRVPRKVQVSMVLSEPEDPQLLSRKEVPDKTAIIGSGPAGIAAAIMLAKRGWPEITVYDRLDRPPKSTSSAWDSGERSYNIGINPRGLKPLTEMGVLPRITEVSRDVVGRKDWTPETPEGRVFVTRLEGQESKLIQRDRLAACLLEEAEETYGGQIKVMFNSQCNDVAWTDEGVEVKLSDPEGNNEYTQKVDFVVGADGVKSRVREAMVRENAPQGTIETREYEDRNMFVYKTIVIKPPKDFRLDLNYSVRTKDDIILQALPTKEGYLAGIILFRPTNKRIAEANTAEEIRALFKECFPMFNDCITDHTCESFASKSPSRLPRFQYCANHLHRDDNTVLIGDAIHAVKPFFGLGVNSAFEDIGVLQQCLTDGETLAESLNLFTTRRAKEAQAIVEISRSFDRPGVAGFFSFVFPIILDRMFGKETFLDLAKDPSISFTEAITRKRLDRGFQMAVLATLFWGLKDVVIEGSSLASVLMHSFLP